MIPLGSAPASQTYYLHTLQTGVHNASLYKLNHFRSALGAGLRPRRFT